MNTANRQTQTGTICDFPPVTLETQAVLQDTTGLGGNCYLGNRNTRARVLDVVVWNVGGLKDGRVEDGGWVDGRICHPTFSSFQIEIVKGLGYQTSLIHRIIYSVATEDTCEEIKCDCMCFRL